VTALLGLGATLWVGLHMAAGHAGLGLPEYLPTWRFAHAHLGLIGWVGMLIAAISWQVVPMFYLAPEVPGWAQRAVKARVAVSVAGLLLVYVLGLPVKLVGLAALPGAYAVWILNPWMVAVTLRNRRRRRADASVWFWWLSLAASPLCFVGAVAAFMLDVAQISVVYGLLALWGWAGALVHGMLTRIVPFLVWFHRCAPLVGLVKVPSARELYPDRAVALGFWLHTATLVTGLLAAGWGASFVWRLFALGLLATSRDLRYQRGMVAA
jgi:hypothetical protein